MMFVNLRHIFITLMFIAGAATLFLGYTGVAGMLFFRKTAPVEIKTTGYQPSNTGISGGGVETREGQGPLESGAAGTDGFFVEYRLQRDKARSQQVEILKDIIGSPASTADTSKAAQEQLLNISRNVSKEARVENLLKARGYREAVVCVDQKGVTVVLESRSLTPAEENKIVDMVSRETGFGEQGIIIVPKV
ncbi:MAG: SpoIIIAH-like family protein [Bacillota bacterium]